MAVRGAKLEPASLPPGTPNFPGTVVRGANFGDWVLFSTTSLGLPALSALQNWSDNDFASAQPSDPVTRTAGLASLDPHAIMLQNGHIVCAFTAQVAGVASIETWVSTDGGRTWTQQSNVPPCGLFVL